LSYARRGICLSGSGNGIKLPLLKRNNTPHGYHAGCCLKCMFRSIRQLIQLQRA